MNCNAIFTNLKEEYTAANALTELEVEASAMAAHLDEAGPSGTRSSKTYLEDHLKVGPNKATEVQGEFARLMELFRSDAKKGDKAASSLFQFDIIAQLANILARVTL